RTPPPRKRLRDISQLLPLLRRHLLDMSSQHPRRTVLTPDERLHLQVLRCGRFLKYPQRYREADMESAQHGRRRGLRGLPTLELAEPAELDRLSATLRVDRLVGQLAQADTQFRASLPHEVCEVGPLLSHGVHSALSLPVSGTCCLRYAP